MGFIYIRNHESYEKYNGYKLGITENYIDRDNQYKTSEIIKGIYELIIEIKNFNLLNLEKILHKYFITLNLHIKYNGGTEFFDKKIINLIIPFLEKTNINFKVLTREDINTCQKKYHFPNINYKKLIEFLKFNYTPRDYQFKIINKAVEYYKTNDKGILVLMCGIGKTLISLWITQKLNAKTVLIGVPNILLLEQWKKIIKKLFINTPYFIVSGNKNLDEISKFIEENKKKCIIITTYSSSNKVNTVTKNLNFTFDMKINDEVHHLCSNTFNLEENTKEYIEMMKIKSIKQISLTATLKYLDNENKNIFKSILSNDNIEYFGNIIDKKTLLWAIKKNIICDYLVQSIVTNEKKLEKKFIKFNINNENDKRLFLSAFVSLKSISKNHSHHLLIYANNQNNSDKIIYYINLLLQHKYFEIPQLYYASYHSKSTEQISIIKNFEKSKYGIISCVYCLGEGWDFPLLDGVVFAENMTSNIRIVQSALRASRKNKNEPNKKTKIILPLLNQNGEINSNIENISGDLKKIRIIVYHIGTEDITIIEKFKVYEIDIDDEDESSNATSTSIANNNENIIVDELGTFDEELTEQLKLKTINRLAFNITYKKAINIIAKHNIKNKEEYFNLCNKDCRLSKEPDLIFGKDFKGWIEYLNIKNIYYDLETCKNKINQYNLKYNFLEINIIIDKLCKLDNNFPPKDLWTDYYQINNLLSLFENYYTKKHKINKI
jgi:superfamily II DNA or RNA helicase